MKNKIWLITAIVVVALIGIIVAIPFLIPASQYRASLQKAASEATGRDVKINGPLRFAFYPALGLTAQQVTISNVKGGSAPLFANINELNVGVAVGPLLKGDVEVKKLILNQPKIALEADVGGKPNWVFEPKPKTPEELAKEKPIDLDRMGLGDARIVDGTLTYRDKVGKVQTITALNAQIDLKSLDAPFALISDFTYSASPVKFTLNAPTPRAFVEKKPTLINMVLESDKLTAKIDGALDPNTFAITGKLDAKGPNLRRLSAWVGSPIGEGGGMQQFAVIGDFKAEGPRTDLTNANIVVDDAKGSGNLTIIAPDGAVPYVKGVLLLEALDVNPYLAAPQSPDAADAAKGVDVNKGWGGEKIDLSGLKAINADLAITTGKLTFQKMQMDRAEMDVALKGGLMRTTMKRLDLYGGRGAGVLVLDARGDALRLQNSLAVVSIDAKSFLKDAIAMEKIEGKAKITIAIAGEGSTQQAIMNTLNGSTDFSVENGAISGVNLAQIARQIDSALTGAAVGPAAQTDFAELAASFAISKGVAHTNDLRMLNPFVRITGAGDINLAAQTMDMKIIPKAVKTIEGQGGKQDISGIGVPFLVKGPWAKLKFSADLAGLVQDRVGKEIDKLSKSFNEGGFPGLFGQKPKPAPAAPAPATP
jgi:AsmA protein